MKLQLTEKKLVWHCAIYVHHGSRAHSEGPARSHHGHHRFVMNAKTYFMKHAKQHIDPFPKYIGKEIWYHVMDQLMEIVKKSNGQEAGNLRQFKSNEFKILKPRPIPESEKTENQRRFEATKIHVEQSFEYLGTAFNEKFLNYF